MLQPIKKVCTKIESRARSRHTWMNRNNNKSQNVLPGFGWLWINTWYGKQLKYRQVKIHTQLLYRRNNCQPAVNISLEASKQRSNIYDRTDIFRNKQFDQARYNMNRNIDYWASVMSWRSVLLVEETGVPRENHWQTSSDNVVSSTLRHEQD